MKPPAIREGLLLACAVIASPSKYDLIKAYLYLQWSANQLSQELNCVFSRFGVSHDGFAVLMLLGEKAGQSRNLSYLAKECGVTRATMTGLIDTLERNDLVKRHKDPYDRRCTHVILTEKGINKVASILPEFLQRISQIMNAMSKTEHDSLLVLLQKLFNGSNFQQGCRRIDSEAQKLLSSHV